MLATSNSIYKGVSNIVNEEINTNNRSTCRDGETCRFYVFSIVIRPRFVPLGRLTCNIDVRF